MLHHSGEQKNRVVQLPCNKNNVFVLSKVTYRVTKLIGFQERKKSVHLIPLHRLVSCVLPKNVHLLVSCIADVTLLCKASIFTVCFQICKK